MKRSEANKGTQLHALIVGFQTGTTMESVLKQWDHQSDPSWGELALHLQRQVVEGVHQSRVVAEAAKGRRV